MALQKDFQTNFGVYNYWIIYGDAIVSPKNNTILLTLALYISREQEHGETGNSYLQLQQVTISLSDWFAAFEKNADGNFTRASYQCVHLLEDWKDAVSVLETGQVE